MSSFLGGYYLSLAAMNGVAACYLWVSGRGRRLFGVPTYLLWLFSALAFTIVSPLAASGDPALIPGLSQGFRNVLDAIFNPVVYSVGSLVLVFGMFFARRFFVNPTVAWIVLNSAFVFMGLSMTDPDFFEIVKKPDNVPIVGMVYLLGFFTWVGASQAVKNDDRRRQGLGPLEAEDQEKVLVWPDLVYTEMICMIGLMALLIVWAILLQAPLEEPASSVKTPNPSKAPWYFLGLQEMLVYFDPWMAGVVLPSMVVFGLMAVPFIDFNKAGSGYYTIDERKFAYMTFQFGFLVLWVTLIVMGTFLRGPNWNFFGLYETWDPHKVEALNNVDLSEIVWIEMLGMERPRPAPDDGLLVGWSKILLRESPGIILVVLYLAVLPPALVLYSKFFRGMFVRMGFLRYMLLTNLLLFMMMLPIKMVCRWTFNLKYIIAIPEYLTNF
ncbi:MAG: hypothetical protein ABGX07_00950 [Pirellulaceae bacterium]